MALLRKMCIWHSWIAFVRTGWRIVAGCFIFIRHFPQKSPVINGSFAKNDLQLEAFYGSSPPCMYAWHALETLHMHMTCIWNITYDIHDDMLHTHMCTSHTYITYDIYMTYIHALHMTCIWNITYDIHKYILHTHMCTLRTCMTDMCMYALRRAELRMRTREP